MGSRDFRHKEPKKQKKDAKKLAPITILKPSTEVEIIQKKKKERKEEEE